MVLDMKPGPGRDLGRGQDHVPRADEVRNARIDHRLGKDTQVVPFQAEDVPASPLT